jgi:flavin reductase (DIM6/NTAB) family NADH-FMN oxidoreductase RutF
MKIEMANLAKGELHDLMGSIIVPRPAVLISTVSEDGVYNAAPFGTISNACPKPPIISVSVGLRRGQKKDTLRNIEFSGDFVVNLVDETLIKATIQTSANYPSNVDEIKEVGLTAIAADKVKSPRVAGALVSLECRLLQKLELGEQQDLRTVIFGEVVLAHVTDELMVDGKIEPSLVKSIGNLGPGKYCRTTDIFPVEASPI